MQSMLNRHTGRAFRSLAVLFAVLFAVMGGLHTAWAAPSDTGGAQSAAQELVVGYSPGFGFLNLLAAKNVQPEGVKVTYKKFLDFNDMIGAVIAGNIDLTEIGDAGAVMAFSRGADIRIIASTASNAAAHGFIVGPNSHAQSFADLKGQRIALNKATNAYPFFLKAIAKLGLKESDFSVTEISADEGYASLLTGKIGAAAAIQPSEDKFLEKYGGHELVNGVGLIQNYYPYVVPRRILDQKRDALQKFVVSLRETVRWAAAHPDEHATLVSNSLGVSRTAIRSGYAKGAKDLIPVDGSYRKNLQATVQDFVDAGVLKPIDISALVDDRFDLAVFGTQAANP